MLAGRDSYAYQPGSNKLSTITTRNGSSLSAASITGTRAYTLDERGNMVVEDRGPGLGVNAAYDAYGRLTGYARSGEASLTHSYNGLDDRVASVTAAAGGGSIVTQRFVYDARGRILGEYGTDSTQLRAEFIWLNPEGSADDGVGGHMPLALSLPDLAAGAGASQIVWSYGNHLGVPLVTSNASGQVIAMPGGYNAAGFPGQSRTFADLYYNRYRDFDSVTGRYIQADPIGLAGGPNPYSYAMGNPVRYSDSQGLFIDTLVDVGFVGYDLYRILNDNILGNGKKGSLGTNLTALGLDLGGALIPGITGLGSASRVARHGDELSDATLVCRGGACKAESFLNGSGVTRGADGTLTGVSAQSRAGVSVNELAQPFRHNQVGVTTVGDIRQAGGRVTSDGSSANPNHATVDGLTAGQLEKLFTPTIPNPVPASKRGI